MTLCFVHSLLRRVTISRAVCLQKSWPFLCSSYSKSLRSTRLIKSFSVYWLSADLQKCILLDKKCSGSTFRLVKLHRPPPDIKIFLPIFFALSRTSTFFPRAAAVAAQNNPAAPPPMIITSQKLSWRDVLFVIGYKESLVFCEIHITDYRKDF